MKDLLIYRPFSRDLFTRGQKPGLHLLLRVWRGEDIDWKAIELEHMPSKRCPGCNFVKYKHDYPISEWKHNDKRGNCSKCLARHREEGNPFECNACCRWLPAEAFLAQQCYVQSTHKRVCLECMETRECKSCHVHKVET